jgi:hypothetical protein
MAYRVTYTLNISWVPDGAGPMSVPSAQTKGVSQSGALVVPGANAPTAANIVTACAAAGADASTQLTTAANLAQIQGFASGGN